MLWKYLPYLFHFPEDKYSWLSLSRPRLSRIIAYLEVKVWSLPKHENLITGNKILWKRGEIAPYFQYTSTYTFIKCGCSIYFFLKSANLICRSTDIWRYFRESLGIRDKESRLYIDLLVLVCVEVFRPNEPNGVMSSAVSLPNHTFTGQA